MLAANIPVCYAGMSGQNNNSNNNIVSNQNSNQNNSATITISANSGSSTNNSTLNNANGGANSSNNSAGLIGGGTTTATAATKNQLEQLNTMREALFSQDGWGCQHVNQDTNWEVPSSPEPAGKDPTGGPPLWKPTINNGTDLWESNLRNGGQPTSQPVQKTPWGHTPTSNLGGTWGEDDDGADSTNVWTGSAANPVAAAAGVNVAVVSAPGVGAGGSGGTNTSNPQWGQGAVVVGANANTVGNVAAGGIGGVSVGGAVNTGANVPGNAGNNTTSVGAGNGWGDPRDLRPGPIGAPIDIRNVDPRDAIRAASAGDPRDMRMLDPRDPIRGDPRGISGRLNGTSEMWGQHHPIAQHSSIQTIPKMVGPGGVNNAGNVSSTVVSSGNIVPNVGGINPAVGVSGNINTQWGNTQTVGPKDITSLVGKQVTGWEEPSPPPQRRNMPNYDDGTSLWGSQQSRVPGAGSHWKDIPDSMNRSHLLRNAMANQGAPGNTGVVTNLGGGNTVGGVSNNQTGNIPPAGVVGVTGNPNNAMGALGGPQGRIPSTVGVGAQHKPENAMWVHPSSVNTSGRNPSTWGDDGSHNIGVGLTPAASWIDDKSNNLGQMNVNNSWNDSNVAWGKGQQNKMSTGGTEWGAAGTVNENNDINPVWSSHSIVGKSQPKLGINITGGVGGINSDMIKQSKQYRILVESGFKKDDAERALINANMNVEEAAEYLRAANTSILMDGWRRLDDTLGSYTDHANNTGAFPGRYPNAGTQPGMSFPPNNLLNSNVVSSTNNPNLTNLNSVVQPIQLQKYLQSQNQHNTVVGAGGPQSANASLAFNPSANVAAAASVAGSTNNSIQPSAQQLRMLVQQIQLAVHSGYLSSQILNQPLAPTTLLLLNQLLSNIKHLQGAQQSLQRGNSATNLQINMAIAKYKQQIQNLQTQINAQQSMYIKTTMPQQQQTQQQQQNPSQQHINSTNTEYLRSHDALNALQGNFAEININKSAGGYQTTPNQQSRLTQWKLPVLEKDNENSDFSRAPGATKQNLVPNAANNIGSLGLQNDVTWSTGRNISDGWPDSSNDNENKDWSVAQTPTATAYTDLVQEFEPGKPWKIKSIEDDPSITPGSVARSPLSIIPTPKEADIFTNASKNSPTDLPPLSLSSSTWSFNPSVTNQNFPSWSDTSQQCSTELWANTMNKTSRGPPPGLGSNKGGGNVSIANASNIMSGNSNGWLVSGGRNSVPSGNTNWSGNTNSSWSSNWLLLKNLTNQIDGSTLRTLCMQHGPLHNFHLYLNQGVALCKYATREEAAKAQNTLNNCALGNTTICAESPSETEVQSILQHLPQTSNLVMTPNNGGNNGGNGGGNGNNNNGGNGGGSNNNANGNSNNGTNVNGGSSNPVHNVNNSTNSGNNVQAVNNPSGGNNGGNNANNASSSNTNSATWRQQTPNQGNQSRPSGRETDFDYKISKIVCDLVDD